MAAAATAEATAAAAIAEGTLAAATAEATVAAATYAEATVAAAFAEGAVVTAVLKVVLARTDWHWPAAFEAAFGGPSIQTSRCAEWRLAERRRERSGFSVSRVLGGR